MATDIIARGLAASPTIKDAWATSRGLNRPVANYLACIDMSQGAPLNGSLGDSIDLSGNGANLTVLSGLGANAWTTSGYFTSGAGTGLVGFIPTTGGSSNFLSFNLGTQSVIFAFRVKAAAPAATQYFMGNGSPAATTNVQGVFFAARSTGKLAVYVNTAKGDTSSGTIQSLTNSNATVFDGTDHSVMVAIDGLKGNMYVFIDGRLDSITRNISNLGSGGTTTSTSHWAFGMAGVNPTTNIQTTTSYAYAFSGLFHALAFTGSLPLNLMQIAKTCYQFPRRMLTYGDIQMPTKSICISVVGQSNEQGAASEPAQSGQLAAPHADPISGSTLSAGGVRGWWCNFVTSAGEYGVWADVHPTAIGSTSIIHNWCGVLRTWSSGMLVTRGTYVLYGGNVYQNVTGIYSNTTPVTSTTTPAVGTGADGITWALKGAARAQDVPNYIYPYTDAYFDPNGFCAGAYWPHQGRVGYDQKWMFLSIGQGDKTMSTSSAEFAAGYGRVADYFLNNGIKVALGFTCYGLTSGLEAYYQSTLLPGYATALSNYSGNPNVVAGANLRTAVGVIPTSSDPTALPGLQSDQLHMNNQTLPLAANAWIAACQAAGIIPNTRLL